jgi:HSP20 family protein
MQHPMAWLATSGITQGNANMVDKVGLDRRKFNFGRDRTILGELAMTKRQSQFESPVPSPGQPDEVHLIDSSGEHWRLTMRSPHWRPPTDVFETETAFIVRVEIAGMVEDDFSIELDGRILFIRGVRPDQEERRAYHQMEIRFGEFSSELEIPAPVKSEEVRADYKNGFLKVILPKALPQKIEIID